MLVCCGEEKTGRSSKANGRYLFHGGCIYLLWQVQIIGSVPLFVLLKHRKHGNTTVPSSGPWKNVPPQVLENNTKQSFSAIRIGPSGGKGSDATHQTAFLLQRGSCHLRSLQNGVQLSTTGRPPSHVCVKSSLDGKKQEIRQDLPNSFFLRRLCKADQRISASEQRCQSFKHFFYVLFLKPQQEFTSTAVASASYSQNKLQSLAGEISHLDLKM